MDYILYSAPLQGDAEPVLRLVVDGTGGMDAVPTDVSPYDPEDERLIVMARSLITSIHDHPEDNTLGKIAVSYGGLTDKDGRSI